MSASCRYEILLPLRFNDGQDVPEALLVDVVLELRHKFQALTSKTQIIQGLWESEGVIFRDEPAICRPVQTTPESVVPPTRHPDHQSPDEGDLRIQSKPNRE